MKKYPVFPIRFLRERFEIEKGAKLESFSKPPCGKCRSACCKTFREVYLTETEKPFFKLDAVGNLAKKEGGLECYYLSDKGCSIYAGRPEGCRSFDCRDADIVGLHNKELIANGKPLPKLKPDSNSLEDLALFAAFVHSVFEAREKVKSNFPNHTQFNINEHMDALAPIQKPVFEKHCEGVWLTLEDKDSKDSKDFLKFYIEKAFEMIQY